MSTNVDPETVLNATISLLLVALSLTAAGICWRYRRLSRWTLLLLAGSVLSASRWSLYFFIDVSTLRRGEFLNDAAFQVANSIAFALIVPEAVLIAGGVVGLLERLVPRLFGPSDGLTPGATDATSSVKSKARNEEAVDGL